MASKFQVTNNLSPKEKKEKKEVGRWQIVSWEFESDIISKQARTLEKEINKQKKIIKIAKNSIFLFHFLLPISFS